MNETIEAADECLEFLDPEETEEDPCGADDVEFEDPYADLEVLNFTIC